jgi:signal peptidase II
MTMLIIMIAGLTALDQITKYAVRSSMSEGETLPVIRDVFHITYVRNRGAAFSLFQDQKIVTLLIPAAVMVICAVFLVKLWRRNERLASAALALIIAGGVGNLIDRIARGYVTDMFDFRVFPVFNVADICVTCGCALLILWIVFFEGRRSGE